MDAYYKKKRGDLDNRRRSGYWTIECYEDGGSGGGSGGGVIYNGDKDFNYNDDVTSATEEGISMSFWIHETVSSKAKKWPCSVMSDDPWSGKAAISKSTSGKVTIPEIVPGTKGCSVENVFGQRYLDLDGLIVTIINVAAFFECKNLKEVVIPSSVESIQTQAFDGCTSLEQITLLTSTPPKVENEKVFMQEAYSRVIVRVPKGAKSAYKNANIWKKFSNIFEEGESIGYKDGDTFSANTKEGAKMIFTVINAQKKTCMVGYDNSEYLIDYAVDNQTKGAVTIPSSINGYSVEEIGAVAFEHCKGFTSINIPNSVKSIKLGAFSDCSGLTSINIPNSVTTIGESAFGWCI